jgi:hypothetical protein
MMRRLLVVSAAGIGLLSTTTADAQDWRRKERPVTESYLAIEMRFGPYRPNVDEGVGLVPCNGATGCTPDGPFHKVFGDDRRFMVGGEVDWQFVHIPHFASLAVGGTISYTSFSGPAVFKDGSGESAETASLSIWPFSALAVVRLEVLARDLGVPLVPYLKVGPGVAFWSSSNGRGTSRDRKDGTEGRGHTFGLTYSIGGAFLLDFLDPQSAKTFSIERGVRHTYLFAEYTVLDYRGLGMQTKPLYLGDKTWNIGFMFEL